MPKGYSFDTQLDWGKAGEQAVYTFLRAKPETVDVRDLSESSHWQPLGIDALWIREGKNGILYGTFFDVKTDLFVHKSGGLFIETSTNFDSPGCMLTTKAEFFLYYDPVLGKLYHVPINALREWYSKKGRSKKHMTVKNDAGYESEGFVLMLEEAENVLGYVEMEDMPPLELAPNAV